MKKMILTMLAIFIFATGLSFAQIQETKESSLSDRNIPIYRVLDHKDVYIVLYSKHGVNVGKVMIPKRWYTEKPKKLQIRRLDKGLDAFMTVVYKYGEFYKAILTTPNPKTGDVWAVAEAYTDIGDAANAETLEIEF